MSKAQHIKLGKGLSDLPFGATRDEVSAILGDPEEVDQIDLGDEESIAWHYWNLGISLNFDESENYMLCTIEVASPEVTLFDKQLIGMKRDEVITFLDGQNIGSAKPETSRGMVYEDVELYLWFNGGELAEIQWGPIDAN